MCQPLIWEISEMMNIIEIPKHVLANIKWINSDDPKYKSRSRETYPYCEKDHPEDKTEPMAYIYKNANSHLYLHCHRCGCTVSIAQQLGKWNVPRISGNPIELSVDNGDQLYIAGANGSGKSALIQKLVSEHPHENIKRITAHRQTSLRSGDINYAPAQRKRYNKIYLDYNRNNASRYLDEYSSDEQSAILFDLDNKYNTINEFIANDARKEDWEKVKETKDKLPSPLDQINELLDIGGLNVNLERTKDRSIIANHSQGQSFDISKMSDGERSAMIIAAHVITAEPDTVLLIDEPEKHLHRSISQPFLSALFDLRPDCAFIISTHEIDLAIANTESQVLMLRSCQWEGDECVAWDAKVIEPNFQLPEYAKLTEEFKREILGSRKRILFVEGYSNSLDLQLYEALFRYLTVIPKGSCENVINAVLGLRESQEFHHVEVFGLIDGDNREKEVDKLAESDIFALEVYSVEALYYYSEVIAAVARRHAESWGVDDPNEVIGAFQQEAIEVLRDPNLAKRMAARRCERQVQELFRSKTPNWRSIMNTPTQSICVPIDPHLYSKELKHFNTLVDNGELDSLIARYPLRDSQVFETIVKTIGCPNQKLYQDLVVKLVRDDENIAEYIKKRMGQLSKVLDSHDQIC